MPTLSNPYVTLDLNGTRFAAYERDASFFQALEGSTNKLRVTVFHSADGKKNLHLRLERDPGEGITDGRVALSDDGSLVALVRGHEVLIFALTPPEWRRPKKSFSGAFL